MFFSFHSRVSSNPRTFRSINNVNSFSREKDDFTQRERGRERAAQAIGSNESEGINRETSAVTSVQE